MVDLREEHGERGRSFGLRYWVMSLLAKKEMTGAMIIDEISRKSQGYWKPSPGSIYPVLGMATSSGMLKIRAQKGKKYYTLSAKGKKYFRSIRMPKFTFSMKSEREDSIGESIEAMEYSINYLMDNMELLRKDTKNSRRVRELMRQLEGAM